ncbi:hypothetical protein STCU_09691 [Strigomonas culicis]|uniref:Nodulin-like domain-containing protein n=2 Tax=Strigomonas culicis TaxID=28005 RepID=S9TQP8_9TRYP|nr:hypothetical protein STCU_09691 [Strigomonas culicis]|eukprot:EPY18959.1 hypothetical protein STCU_09691 [Strigomonas culicis]
MNPFKKAFDWPHTLEERQRKHLHIINELQRCRLLFFCLLCCTGVSIVYTFELFTKEFSTRYGFSAGDLSTISTVGACFCYFLMPYAVVYEFMGPVPLLLLATVAGLIGMLGLGLVFQNVIPGNLTVICVFYAFMNTCGGLFDAASIVTLQHTFPRNRGPVLALAKVMTGLGSSVFASISSNLFVNNLSGFLYFVMVYAMVVALSSCFVLVLPPYVLNWWRERQMTEEEKESARSLSVVYDSKNVPVPRLAVGYAVAISLILFFSTSSPILAYLTVSQKARYVLGTITCLLLCSYGIMALPLRCLGGVDEPSPALEVAGQPAEGQRKSLTEPIVADADVVASEASDRELGGALEPYAAYMDPDAIKYTDPKYPGTFWDALRGVDFYLIYFGFILQGAIGSIVLYNSSTIYVARTGKSRSTQLSALYTAFLGIGSALGRIAVGIFEAFVQRQPEGKRRLLVTMALPAPAIIGTIGGILILILPGDALLLPFILVYFKQGAFYSTCAVTFPSLFRTHLSIYYNLSSATTVVCVICFNRFLFGYMVDKKRDELKLTGDCTSRDCILTPIIVATCLSAASSLLLVTAHIRYRRYVRRCEAQKQADSEPLTKVEGSNA